MKTVWKFPVPFPPKDRFSITAPKDAKWLDVQIQHESVAMWALVDPDSPEVTHQFRWAGTGHPIEPLPIPVHVATLQTGALVWHVFWLSAE